jgi:hypothetical protein
LCVCVPTGDETRVSFDRAARSHVADTCYAVSYRETRKTTDAVARQVDFVCFGPSILRVIDGEY